MTQGVDDRDELPGIPWVLQPVKEIGGGLGLIDIPQGFRDAAVIVERAEHGEPGIALAAFTTISEHSRLCFGLPAPHSPGARMFTKARTIHKVAMQDAPPLLEELLARRRMQVGDIDWLIPHQTSERAIRAGERELATRFGERPKHTVVTVDELGNTASTTHFVALHRLLGEHRIAHDKLWPYEEAVRVCRTGLERPPTYLAAHVTLGRALIALEQFSEARVELERVLHPAPDNHLAQKGMNELQARNGNPIAAEVIYCCAGAVF